MKNQPKVSIIVPVYNVEEYLVKCLDSLVNQTLKEIEIICINDGSTDNSLEILNTYAQKDSRITIIDKKNEGVSAARNTGLNISKGEYIMFVDSDDYLELPNVFFKEEDVVEKIKYYVENNFELEPDNKEKYNKFFYTKENIRRKLVEEIDRCCT